MLRNMLLSGILVLTCLVPVGVKAADALELYTAFQEMT